MENGIRTGLKSWISFPVVTKRDLRIFGLLFAGILFLIRIRHHHNEPSMLSVACLSLVLVSVFWPEILKLPHAIWTTIGHLLGSINTRIILVILYVTIFVPVGITLRLLGKRLIDTRFIESSETYRTIATVRTPKHFEYPF